MYLGNTDPAAVTMQPTYDEWEPYVFDYELPSGASRVDLTLLIEDSTFLWTSLWGTADGNYTLNVKKPNGRSLASAMVQKANLVGTASFPVVLKPAVRLLPNSRLGISLTDLSGADNTIQLLFGGYRQYPTR